MADVNDVAAEIVRRTGPISAMKLQKLVYYAQAWSLVWDERPMFKARIEAWANGPVVPDLYRKHRGRFTVDAWDGNPRRLSPDELDTIDVVVRSYGKYTAQQLSNLTHAERPWIDARRGLAPTTRSNQEIPLESMQEYYSAVAASEQTRPV